MGAVFDRACAAGFTPLLPAGHPLPPMDDHDRTRELIAGPDMSVLVAEDGDRLLAFTMFGVNRDDDAGAGVAEIRMFFADPDAWGGGAAPRLMGEALEALAEQGYQAVTLWSFDSNGRANAFYERHGMERDGAERTQEVWADLPQVRYRRSLVLRSLH
jgi:RimJ/RimL family protein N-acetyltransferase